ncbi:MAG: hypothetical protein AAFX94_07505 [Myxococcota bacterium]
MKYALPVLALIAFVSLFRCASQTRLAPEIRQTIQRRHVGKTVALRSSCYYGDLYDENERWLLSPHPFADTYHIVDTDGSPIHPTGERGIVPAGSTFRITRIEFPDMEAMATRMLTTPRYNPWVYLEPVEGVRLQGRSSFIMVLPMDLETEDGVERALNQRLGRPDDIQGWLDTRRPTVKVAIRHKDPVPGMSEDELRAAWGTPMLWFVEESARVAWYRSREVWLSDGAVTEIRPARPVPTHSIPQSDTSGSTPATVADRR